METGWYSLYTKIEVDMIDWCINLKSSLRIETDTKDEDEEMMRH